MRYAIEGTIHRLATGNEEHILLLQQARERDVKICARIDHGRRPTYDSPEKKRRRVLRA